MSLRGAMRLMNRDDKDFLEETKDMLIDVLVAIEVDSNDEYQEAAVDLNNAYLSFLRANEEEEKLIPGKEAYGLFVRTYGKIYMGKNYDEEYAFSSFLPTIEWDQFSEIHPDIVKEVAETSASHDKAAIKLAWKHARDEKRLAASESP